MNETNSGNQPASTALLFFPHDGVDIRKILMELYHYKWIILAVSMTSFFIAFLYTFTIQPTYQTTALLQVHPQSANAGVLSKLGYKSSADSALETQQALIRTRYILEPVIIQTGLNISVTPHYYPLFGAWMARHHSGDSLARPLFRLKSYAWGGEKIEVSQFTVPEEYVGQTFKLIAGKNNSYQLFSPEGELLLTGKAGELSTSAKTNALTLKLGKFQANPGTQFSISYKAPIYLVNSLANNLRITDVYGNDPAQNTGIFQLTLTDSDPARVVKLLNGIAHYTVIKNRQQNAEEAQETLEFLNRRLPELRNKLASAEDAVNQYHIQNNTLSMSMISQLLLHQLTTLEQAIDKLKTEREELLQLYMPEHPQVLANISKEDALQKRIDELKGEIRKFPLINQEEINLVREAKIKNSMYLYLLNSEQQLEIAKAGLSSDIVVLSDAVPASKIPSHKMMIIFMGFFMGAFLSIAVLLLKNALNKTIEDSEQIEDAIKLPVQCVLPFSRKQKRLEKAHKKGMNTFGTGLSAPLILAKQEPDDITIESLRSLRISLNMLSPSAHHQAIALMGSLPGIGKSFVSLNLSQVIADSGKRTLLIDGDIRKGLLHRALNQPKSNGLSEYLEGKCQYEELARHINENLFYIPCGNHTAHPIQLFQSNRFQELIKKTKQDFDQVIIDTPPILPVIDSVLISKYCEIKLFVVSAGKDTIGDVKLAVKKARACHIEINGIVLNHSKPLKNAARYEYRYTYGDVNTSSATT